MQVHGQLSPGMVTRREHVGALGAEDVVLLLWVWGHGCVQSVKDHLTVPVTFLHAHDSRPTLAQAPILPFFLVSGKQPQEETDRNPRAPRMGTGQVKGATWSLRGDLGRRERKRAAAS